MLLLLIFIVILLVLIYCLLSSTKTQHPSNLIFLLILREGESDDAYSEDRAAQIPLDFSGYENEENAASKTVLTKKRMNHTREQAN